MRRVLRKLDWIWVGTWFGCLSAVKLGILIHDYSQPDSGTIFWIRTCADLLILVSFVAFLSFLFFSFQKVHRLRSEFLATISHELRTPLTSMGGYVSMVLAGEAGAISKTQDEYLKIVNINVARLTQLIDEILDLESVEAGRLPLRMAPEDLSTILTECCETFRAAAQQKQLRIHYETPAQEIRVFGDRTRLIQIFMNLISNAVKYTLAGTIEVSIRKTSHEVEVLVRDSGIGVSQEDQEKLFQKFYRARSQVAPSTEGTGLGLVIARGLVAAHRGKIAVKSQLGKGTEVKVSLPSYCTTKSVK